MTQDTPWRRRSYHRDWLMAEANRMFDMYQFNAVNPKGGFFDLDAAGKPLQLDDGRVAEPRGIPYGL